MPEGIEILQRKRRNNRFKVSTTYIITNARIHSRYLVSAKILKVRDLKILRNLKVINFLEEVIMFKI